MDTPSISAVVELSQSDTTFWTNGETIKGDLCVESISEEGFSVQMAQISLVCEEWVHTGNLEFKEHYRYTECIFGTGKNSSDHAQTISPLLFLSHDDRWSSETYKPVTISPGKRVHLPFRIAVPSNNSLKKFPPSFSMRYNAVQWSLKAVIGYTPDINAKYDKSNVQGIYLERPILICTRCCDSEGQSSVETPPVDEFSYTVLPKDLIPISVPKLKQIENGSQKIGLGLNTSQINVQTVNTAVESPSLVRSKCTWSDMSLQLRMRIPQYAFKSKDKQLHMPVSLDISLSGTDSLIIESLDLTIDELVHTYSKEPIVVERNVRGLTKPHTLKRGENKLEINVEADQLQELTEDFKTEWQQITHNLKLTFICDDRASDSQFMLRWGVPMRVQSKVQAQPCS